MIAKFNTMSPSGVTPSTGKGGTVKTLLIVGLVAAVAYGLYRYMNRDKAVTTVYVNDED
jgi:hypothetical protein